MCVCVCVGVCVARTRGQLTEQGLAAGVGVAHGQGAALHHIVAGSLAGHARRVVPPQAAAGEGGHRAAQRHGCVALVPVTQLHHAVAALTSALNDTI